ncbi:MAG TPA: transcriptional regulator [Gemmatimonadota bacterium]|nr:transcriptional regulator [Gemmatimonadota bacterium]
MAPPRGPEGPGPDEVLERLGAIDRLLEHRVRLAISVLLSRYDRLSFSRLKEVTGETDGSLGAHLRRLEDEGYVTVKKEFVDRKPVSWYRLATTGRKALAAHLEALEGLIRGPRG